MISHDTQIKVTNKKQHPLLPLKSTKAGLLETFQVFDTHAADSEVSAPWSWQRWYSPNGAVARKKIQETCECLFDSKKKCCIISVL